MKEQRLEFLKLVLKDFENDQNYRSGICFTINLLRLDYNRMVVIAFFDWFQTQKPHSRFHSKFTKHITFIGGGYWWVRTEEGYNQRVLFLKHLIEKQSK
jgi:hypothetical protein